MLFESHTAVSNNSPVYFADTIDSVVQNCHKKSWATTGLFFPENFSVPLYMTMSKSLLNLFFCCFSKYEYGMEDISESVKLFYLHSGLLDIYTRGKVWLWYVGPYRKSDIYLCLNSGTSLNVISDARNNIICITFPTGDYQMKLFEILELIIEVVNHI